MTNGYLQNLIQLSFIRPQNDKRLPPDFNSIVGHQSKKLQMVATSIYLNCRPSRRTLTNDSHKNLTQLSFTRHKHDSLWPQKLTQLSPIRPTNDKRWPPEFKSIVVIWPPEFNSIVAHQAKKMTNDCHPNLTQLSSTRPKNNKWLPPWFNAIVVHQARRWQMIATRI